VPNNLQNVEQPNRRNFHVWNSHGDQAVHGYYIPAIIAGTVVCSMFFLIYSLDGTKRLWFKRGVWGNRVGVGVESCKIACFYEGTSYSLVQYLAVGCASFGVLLSRWWLLYDRLLLSNSYAWCILWCSIVSIDCFDLWQTGRGRVFFIYIKKCAFLAGWWKRTAI